MAAEVSWSDEAIQTFQQNIHYLQHEWSGKEVIKFIFQTEKIIGRFKKYPFSYPPWYNNKKVSCGSPCLVTTRQKPDRYLKIV
jgi:hypothetical protein